MCVDATIITEGIDWLSVLPVSGTIPANTSLPVQVTFDAADLQPDLYTTTLLILSNDPLNSLVQIPVTMTVQEDEPISGLSVGNDGPTLLGNPTTLFASVVTGTNVTYEWAFGDGTSGSGAEATHIYPHEGSFQAVVTATNIISQLSATTQVDVLPSGYRQYLPFIPWGAGRPVSGETGVFRIWLSAQVDRYWW